MRGHFLLDPEWAFLNHGSFGATPRPVFAAYQRWQQTLERQPVAFFQRDLDDRMHGARSIAADYLGADPADLHFVRNATVGMNTVARSIALQPGDEVLTTDHEYGAVDATWDFVCREKGARLVVQSVPFPYTTDADFIAALWSGVTERTRVISISHITSPTALTFPVVEVCRRAREAGIITVIDGAHAPGQIPLDLNAVGADYYTGNFHKWLCAPKSAGFLHVRPEHAATLYPLIVSWGWVRGESAVDRYAWKGTDDVAAYLSVPDAIAFQAEHDWASVREGCHALAVAWRARLIDTIGGASTSPDATFAQLFTVELPDCDPVAVQDALYHDHRVEVPIIAWGGRQLVRVSVQGYNTADDLSRLVDGLRAVLG
jgi:isopenicillin-N epimerase